MKRVSLSNVHAQPTCTPTHEKHQATPYACFLDPSENKNIYSGMVMMRSGAETVKVYDGSSATALPFGIAALERNEDIDDLRELNGNMFAVWIGGPDAFFTVRAPAFDVTKSYAVPTNGTRTLLYANANGQITSEADGVAIGELINVLSDNEIEIRLSLPTSIPATIQ